MSLQVQIVEGNIHMTLVQLNPIKFSISVIKFLPFRWFTHTNRLSAKNPAFRLTRKLNTMSSAATRLKAFALKQNISPEISKKKKAMITKVPNLITRLFHSPFCLI